MKLTGKLLKEMVWKELKNQQASNTLGPIIEEEISNVLSEQEPLDEGLKGTLAAMLLGLGLMSPSTANAAGADFSGLDSFSRDKTASFSQADIKKAALLGKQMALKGMGGKQINKSIELLNKIAAKPGANFQANSLDSNLEMKNQLENELGLDLGVEKPQNVVDAAYNLVKKAKDMEGLEVKIPNKVIQIGTKQVNKTKAAMKGVKSVDDFKAKMKDVSYKDYESMHQIGDEQKFLLLIPDGHITDINFSFVDSKTKEYLNFTNNLLELDVHDPFTGKTAYRQVANKNTNINKYLARVDLDFMSNLGTLTTNKEKQKRLRQNVKGKDLFDLVIRPEQSTKIPEGHVGFVVSLGGIPTRTVLVQFGMTDKATAALPDPNPQGP